MADQMTAIAREYHRRGQRIAELEAEVERLKSQNHKLKAQLGPSDQEIREQGFRDYGHDIGF